MLVQENNALLVPFVDGMQYGTILNNVVKLLNSIYTVK